MNVHIILALISTNNKNNILTKLFSKLWEHRYRYKYYNTVMEKEIQAVRRSRRF